MKVVRFPERPNAQKPAEKPAEKPKLVDALLDTKAREKIVTHVVDTSREMTTREDRTDYWLALVENYKARALKEGAELILVMRALHLLSRDVKAENEKRRQRSLAAAMLEPPLFGFEASPEAVVVRFPGDEDAEGVDLMVPYGFR